MLNTITIGAISYEIVVIDDNIVLQSIHQDIVHENAYREICRELANEWWKNGAIGSQRAYILEYEEAAILEYVAKHEGQIVIHQNN